MENEKKLKSAKTQHVIFRVFQILGIVMIPVGFALIILSVLPTECVYVTPPTTV